MRLGHMLPVPRQIADCLLVAAEGQPLIETGIELAPEFAQRPTLLGSLNLVEVALLRLESDQEDVVRPTQNKWFIRCLRRSLQFTRQCLGNWGMRRNPRHCLGNWESRELSRRCLENWRNAPRIGKEKTAHIFKIASGKPITELAG